MKILFSSFSDRKDTQYIFNEIPSFDSMETEPIVSKDVEAQMDISKNAEDIIININTLPDQYKISATAELKGGIIPGAEIFGEELANEAMDVINERSDMAVDPEVEWTDGSHTKEEEVIVEASLASENISASPMRKALQNLDEKKGIKGNYISSEKGISVLNESGEDENISLQQGIIKAFVQLNTYVAEHNISNEIFTKACERKGLNVIDIKNIQVLSTTGSIDGTSQDVGTLQNILKKLGLTKGLKKDGTPDKLFGSGTVEDTESLCLLLQSALEQELEWDNFHDTMSPIPNGSLQRFRAGINNIKETGVYDPEKNDPLKLFDETIVAEGGDDYVNGGKKAYTIRFLATLPDDVLTRVASPKSKSIILHNRENREYQKKEWEEFQAQNPEYFQGEMIAKQ